VKRAALLVLAAVLAPRLSLGQTLPTEKYLPASLAAEAALAAVEACQKKGFRVTATVVDRAGVARIVYRGDGAGAHTVEGTLRKAYTAAGFRLPTTLLANYADTTPGAAGLRFGERLMLFGGGLPLKAGNEVVGAIAVGGAPGGDLDDACAEAGRDRIKDRLN
jgi:uncharacterized protein GlcG (DUF336 family)